MTIEIRMPALSPTMTEGNLTKWLKKEGDTVESGDAIAEIETDKATMEVEAADEGVLGRIVVPEGTSDVPVNEVIAVLLEEGEDESALEGAVAESGPSKRPAAKEEEEPEAAPEPKEEVPETTAPEGDSGAPGAVPDASTAVPPPPKDDKGGRIFASPLARRLAEKAGIDLAQLSGSGPHGRIVKRDIEDAERKGIGKAAPATAPAAAAAPVDTSGLPPHEAVAHSSMRKVIAQRLSESKQTIPHFYLTVDCEMDKLLQVRKDLNARSDDYKLSVNDFVIRAAAVALKRVPAANVMWTDDAMLRFERADVSVAVAIDDGLITPVIRDAGSKGLLAISTEMKDLAEKARTGKLTPEEYQGGTFTVSNLGMYGIKHFAAIINPPQACILAVGAGEQRPVVKDGALAAATVMTCTLAVDHRAVDGAVGAQFLKAFREIIEDPMMLLL